MGSCGCGDTRIDLQLPGPDGIVYGLQFYTGCDYCGTPAGVIVYRIDTTDPNHIQWHKDAPEPDWNTYRGAESRNAEFAVPLLDFDRAMSFPAQAPKKAGERADWIEYGMADDLRLHLREVMQATIEEWFSRQPRAGKGE